MGQGNLARFSSFITQKRQAGLVFDFGEHTTVAAADTVATKLEKVQGVLTVLDSDPVAAVDRATGSIGDQAGAPAKGSILINTWKPTATADTIPIAATTFGKKVSWLAWGEK